MDWASSYVQLYFSMSTSLRPLYKAWQTTDYWLEFHFYEAMLLHDLLKLFLYTVYCIWLH